MKNTILFQLVLSLSLSCIVIGESFACSCGPFTIPTPCALISQIESSAEDDFVAIVNLSFVEQLQFSRTFEIEVVETLAGITLPDDVLFEGFDGSLCGQYLTTNQHYGLLVGKLNSEGRVVPSVCQPEDSFFPIENEAVIIKEHNGIPETRHPLVLRTVYECFHVDGIFPLFYITGPNLINDQLDIRSSRPFTSSTTLSIVDAVGRSIATNSPLAPYDTRGLANGIYYAIVRNEYTSETFPFMVAN